MIAFSHFMQALLLSFGLNLIFISLGLCKLCWIRSMRDFFWSWMCTCNIFEANFGFSFVVSITMLSEMGIIVHRCVGMSVVIYRYELEPSTFMQPLFTELKFEFSHLNWWFFKTLEGSFFVQFLQLHLKCVYTQIHITRTIFLYWYFQWARIKELYCRKGMNRL